MITEKYILFTRISLYKDLEGRLFCDPLWAKDLRLHTEYIENFGICCPVEYIGDSSSLTDISDIKFKELYPLRKDYGLLSVIGNVLPNFLIVRNACKNLAIAHSGGAGWAFPTSFYLLFLRIFYSFHWIIVIESSFWMISGNEKKTPRKIFTHLMYSWLLKKCVKTADSRIFTQSFYKNYFLGNNSTNSFINPATWINQSDLVSEQQILDRVGARDKQPLRILYPSRLEVAKGTNVLLEALKILNESEVKIEVVIMGMGDLKDTCMNVVKTFTGEVNVTYEEPVPYDKSFFDKIAQFDYVLVPIINNEQPRIVFDSYSQGVPIIASDTSGILDITSTDDAILFCAGDTVSLANAIISVSRENRSNLLSRSLKARKRVLGKTHRQMHIDREKFLKKTLSCRSRKDGLDIKK